LQNPKPGGPSPIQEAIRSFLRETGLSARPRDERIFAAWCSAAGPELARRAVPVRFRSGELLVEVDSAAHLHELKSFTGEAYRREANGILGSGAIQRVVYKLRH
jgi:hypothetical protein